MTNFKPLNQKEYSEVWDKFSQLFHFQPSINIFPAIKSNLPLLVFDISTCFRPDYPFKKLEEFAIHLFKSISNVGERMYALNWQHECYDFDPRAEMDRDEFGEWVIPIFPNGDYYIFLTRDFKNVWFGHPWEQTITLVGEDIVRQGQKNKECFPR